jgi:hypothetical protein
MSSINEMIARVEKLNIEQLCEDAFNLNSGIAKELNIEQLQRGQGAKSDMPDYSFNSKAIFGKPDGGIRLYETGDFYRGITFEAVNMDIYSYSTDEKNDMIESDPKYANAQPLGLSKSSIIELNKVIQPTLVEEVKKDLGI